MFAEMDFYIVYIYTFTWENLCAPTLFSFFLGAQVTNKCCIYSQTTRRVNSPTCSHAHSSHCISFFLILRPIYRCCHRHPEADQPHRQKCVFQSQDDRTSQILCAPKQWHH